MILVADIMERDVVTIPPNASVTELIQTLEEHGIGGAPVVDEQELLVGVVSQRDVMRLAREMEQVPEAMRWGMSVAAPPKDTEYFDTGVEGEFFAYYVTPSGGFVDLRDQIRKLPADAFEGYRVEDIMSPAPHTIPPSATLRELAQLLREREIHRALVVDHRKLVGIVTTSDVLKALAGA